MTEPVIGVKCYGYDWLLRYGQSEDAAARRMVSHGVDWALIQNSIDPLPSSGVEQVPPFDRYDDRRFRDRLQDNGIRVFESTAVYFQPQANERFPELRPVGDDGRVMAPFDWYLGVSPSSRDYLASREALLEEVVSTFEPDGMFLSFIRFPNFWEAWTPVVERSDIVEYCFSPTSLERFQADTGIDLPAGSAIASARYIQHELRDVWTAWKCAVVEDAVRRLQAAARRVKPDIEIMINGVAFLQEERGDVAREVLGQDLGAISQDADHIESMVYHQILGRDLDWITQVLDELRPKVRGTLLSSLQTTAAYTTPPHDTAGRKPDLDPEEFVGALRATARSQADGLSLYHWTDVLADELEADGVMAEGIRRYKAGEL